MNARLTINILMTKAAKEWGISRISDKKIDVSEILRVFGEPISRKRTERSVSIVQNTPLNNQSVQQNTDIEQQLAIKKLKNEYLSQQVSNQKKVDRELSVAAESIAQ